MAVNELLTANPKPWLQIKANTLDLTGGITLANSGGVQTALNYYEELNFQTSVMGPWTTAQQLTIRLTRIGRTVICTSFGEITGVFGTPSLASLVTLIPIRFRPTGSTTRFYVHVINNGSGVNSHADVTSGGDIIIGVDRIGDPNRNFSGGSCIILQYSFVWTI